MRDIVTKPLAVLDCGYSPVGACRGRLTGFAETFSQYIMEVQPVAVATSRKPIRVGEPPCFYR